MGVLRCVTLTTQQFLSQDPGFLSKMHYKSFKVNGIRAAFLLLICNLGLFAGQTTVLFEPDSVSVGPFPSNLLTLAGPHSKDGLARESAVLRTTTLAMRPPVPLSAATRPF